MSTATPRLLFSSLVRQCKPKTHTSVRRACSRPQQQAAALHTTAHLRQDTYAQRYGPAYEPRIPPPPGSEIPLPPPDTSGRSEKAKQDDEVPPPAEQSKDQPEDMSNLDSDDTSKAQMRQFEQTKEQGTPLDIVLKTPAPSVRHQEGRKPPHLEASPYVHHFDTYTLVQDLVRGHLSEEQAVTIMKAVRSMLAENLEVARDGLVSKSDMENETYLFRAACSELRTSLQTSRHSEMQKQRTNRGQLQHENDILNQRMTESMLSLREELKGLFNERKMASQEEKRRLDAKIQQLNYEITVTLMSDMKREVEGLRWVLTRRAAMALGAAARKSKIVFIKCSSQCDELANIKLCSDDYCVPQLLLSHQSRKGGE